MRRQIIVVFLSLFWLAAPGAVATERGALFKVTGKTHSMLLFGTIHVGQPAFYPLEPRLAQALAAASTLALEVDPMGDPQLMAAAMQEHGLYLKDSERDAMAMAPALRTRLDLVLARAGVERASVASFRPWLVATVLAVAEYSAMGYRPDLSVDLHLAQLAHASDVKVLALESPDAQMRLFGRLSSGEQAAYLESSIELIESGRQAEEVREIVNAWGGADQQALDAIAARVDADRSPMGMFVKSTLLDERNVGIADQLVQLLERENNSVAAIGVLHLLGSNSVPALMRARGLQVERVY